MTKAIAKPSNLRRSDPARGLRGTPDGEVSEVTPIDPTGGDSGQGIIRGASIITRGEALGHGEWIDGDFLQSVADGINAKPMGIKARFTHPSLSGDGLGSFLGRAKSATLDGDRVFADIHFSKSGHNTPDGDLASYVMELAQDAPEDFGVSIAYHWDLGAEELHQAENKDADGIFHSPDSDNTKNFPHARLASLRATDVVDEPAANPDGLFHREQHVAQDADGLLSYALGLSDKAPAMTALDIDPDRARDFVNRFFKSNNLEISLEKTMSNQETTEAPTDTNLDKPAETTPPVETAKQYTGQDYINAFGEANGSLWFTQGVAFDDAQAKHNAAIVADNEELKTKLAASEAAGGGEDSPVGFSEDEPSKAGKGTGLASCINIK